MPPAVARVFHFCPFTPYTTTLPLRLCHVHTSSALQLADALFSTPSLAGALFNRYVAWLIQHLLARDTAGADPRASTPELITWLIQNLLARDTAVSRHTEDDHGLSLPHPDAGILVASRDLPAELGRPDDTPEVVISGDHHGRWELVPASQLRPVPPAVG